MTEDVKWHTEVGEDDLGDHANPYALASQPSGLRNTPFVNADLESSVSFESPKAQLPDDAPSSVLENCIDALADEGVGEDISLPADRVVRSDAGKSKSSVHSPLMNTPEVAAYLNISTRHLYRLRERDPEFPKPINLPGRVTRWYRDDIDAYIARKRVG